MKEYRIVEETLKDNTKRYVIEKRTVLFNKYTILDWEIDTYNQDMGYYQIINIPRMFNTLSEARNFIIKKNKKYSTESNVINRKIIE